MSKTNGKTDRVHILKMRARNVKCLKEVEIDFEGEMHEIKGDTGQGKTSILDSIEATFRGLEPSMVRRGESRAELELVLDAATIKRIVGAEDGKSTVMVTDNHGKRVEKAKEFIDTLCGRTAFRPISWVQLGGGESRGKTERLRQQRDMLLEAIPMRLTGRQVADAVKDLGDDYYEALGEVNLDGVDFDQHAFMVCSAIERACYDYRKLQNSLADEAENKLAVTPAPERSAPKTPLPELIERERAATEAYHTAKARVGNRQALRERVESLRTRVAQEAEDLPDAGKLARTLETYQTVVGDTRTKIEELEKALAEARAELADAESKVRKCREIQARMEDHEARKADLAALEAELAEEGSPDDIAALEKALADARRDVEARRLQDAHDEAAQAAQAARQRAILFSRLVTLFRDELPKRLLEASKLPVEGLGIEGDMVTIHGVPLHQLGTSQQIRVGVLIAAALNPRSGFVLVDGAESLGKKDRAALAEAAKELDLQLILTVVDPDAEPAAGVTVMADGLAKSA